MKLIGEPARQPHRAALGPPVDRRAAAADALRHRRAEDEVPARGCAKGEISAFALTEPDVGSDPARPRRRTREAAGRRDYIINGEKLWCTNGTRREPLRRHGAARRDDARATRSPRSSSRRTYAGRRGRAPLPVHGPARALQRRHPVHRRARPEGEHPLGRGQGPEARADHAEHRPAHASRRRAPARPSAALEIARAWGNERVQWGAPIGKHEAIAQKIAGWRRTTFAMEADDRARARPRRTRDDARHPPRSGDGQAVEHRGRLEDRRRHDADPRRPRLRDRATRCARAARRRSRSSA